MSSHHIVREKQEPALLLLGVNNFSDELLGQLLEWSPTVIATPLVAEQINSYEIKIDVIIADEIGESLQLDIRQIPQGDAGPVEAVLNYLIKNEYKAVNVVTDEVRLEDFIPFANTINIVIYSESVKIYAVKPGFTKWKPAGEIIRILSVYLNLQTSGLIAKGDNTFVTMNDGFINLNFDDDLIFISEDI
jgi:thiamine pyrophosphokinase